MPRGAPDERRRERQAELDGGALPRFLAETQDVREAEWLVAEAPSDLRDRRCEITGPVDRKMMINALNSGARVFMADYEDACSPKWENVVEGQRNVTDAVRREISLETPDKTYRLNEEIATLRALGFAPLGRACGAGRRPRTVGRAMKALRVPTYLQASTDTGGP